MGRVGPIADDSTGGNNGVVSIGLGMPSAPPPVVAPRRASRQLLLRHDRHPVLVGGDAPVSVQSAGTVTADMNSTLQQIAELTAAGCRVVRVAVPHKTMPRRSRSSPRNSTSRSSPTSTSAQVRVRCTGCRLRGVRVNPGNIKQFDDKVGEIARAAADCGTPIRIGVNAGR